jgi:plastocyanin
VSRRLRHLLLCLVALAAGAAAGVAVPQLASVGAAPPATASIQAVDYGWQDPATMENTTNVAAGGTVTFSYPTGGSFHGLVFDDKQPTSCTQTAGPVSGSVPPLPHFPDGAGWAGTCRFDTAGTYAFHCGAHAFMVGSVVVGDPPPTTDTGTTGSTGTSPTTPGGTDTTGETPKPPRVKFARRQRGAVVRGTVATPAGPSKIVIRAFVTSRALAQGAKLVRVGSKTKRSTGAGKTSFALRVNRVARRALGRSGRLSVRLRIVVTPQGGKPVSQTAKVTLRKP